MTMKRKTRYKVYRHARGLRPYYVYDKWALEQVATHRTSFLANRHCTRLNQTFEDAIAWHLGEDK